ncbi:MAG: Ada metal-binding domain-containing protein [Desulfobacterales bacterium]
MQIRRFEAKSMTQALHMIKEEFGPDAVILSARSVRGGRGIFGSRREAAVEVTAAQDQASPNPSAAARSLPRALPEAADPLGGSRGLFRSLNQGLRQLAFRRRPEPSPPRHFAETSGEAAWQRQLSTQEVQAALAAEIIGHLQQCPGRDPLVELRQRLAYLGPPPPAPEDAPRVLVLVGPAGAGKTTTAIKLAARQVARRQPTALLTLDDRRIGALAQLRIYADILGIPLAAAASAAEVGRALERLGAAGTLIVDTPGISPGEAERRGELNEMLGALPAAELNLTLALNTREKDMRRSVEAWKGTPLSGLVFTRLDETDVWGPALNLALQTGLPVSHAAHGTRIPEDLASDPLTMILERMVPASQAAGRQSEADRPGTGAGLEPAPATLVANRSSDLYHRPGCRWVRKIKPENLIQFAAPREAESRQFMPCRNCNPDQCAPAADAPAAGGLRLAGTR